MAEATIATLLISGAVHCWRGWRSRPDAERTIELHTDGLLYCYDEPRNSMAKNLKERLCMRGARVIDCGMHRGRLCFGVEVAGADYIEEPSPSGVFVSLTTLSSSKTSGHASRRRVALFFTGDKLLKWRFISLLRRAAREEMVEHPPPDFSTNWSADSRGVYRQLNRPPRVIDETGDEPLEGHEVEQLADVLRHYEEKRLQQEDRRREGSTSADGDTICDGATRLAKTQDGVNSTHGETASSHDTAPIRLTQSPLFHECIANRSANQFCADCGVKWPTWTLIQPFGALICIRCVGVHRQLWPNKCREAQLDRWNAKDIAFMMNRGNDTLNAELECGGYEKGGEPVYKPVGEFSQNDVRERFILCKYEGFFGKERFPGDPAPPPLDPDGLAAAAAALSASSLNGTAMASPNAMGAVDAHNEEGPPRFVGVAYITLKEAEGVRSRGAVMALTNGFQEVRSQPGVAVAAEFDDNGQQDANGLDGERVCGAKDGCTKWDESFQLGVHDGEAPLYAALYSSADELIGVAEWRLPDGAATSTEPRLVTVPLLWWNGTTRRWKGYGLFGTRRNHSVQSNGEGEVGTGPILYLTVSFGLFG